MSLKNFPSFLLNFSDTEMGGEEKHSYSFKSFRLDIAERQLLNDNVPVALTPKAFDVLVLLVSKAGHLVEKNELMQAVWPESFVEEANLARLVHTLRKTLGGGDGNKLIETVATKGYRFVAEVSETEVEAENRNAKDMLAESRKEEPPFFAAVQNGSALQFPAFEPSYGTQDRVTGPFPGSLEAEAEEYPVEISQGAKTSRWQRYRLSFLAALMVLMATAALVFVYQPQMTGDGSASQKTIRSIAVLPLENLSGDPSQEVFSDGMTEVLNTELGKITQLRIIERTSTSRYKGTTKSIAEIARDLNVDGVATGSALRLGDHVRITIHLYRGADGQNLWSQSYERNVGDVLELQDTIALKIAGEIKVKLSSTEQATLSNGHPVKPETFDLYFNGVEFFNSARNESQPAKRVELFQKAAAAFQQTIALDPEYIDAHVKLVHSYGYLYFFASGPRESLLKLRGSVQALQRLDDSNYVTHLALGLIAHRYDWNQAEAEKEFKRSIELAPNSDSNGLAIYALFLSSQGRQEEAIREMKQAIENDPFEMAKKANLGNIYTRAGQYDIAIDYVSRVAELIPDYSWTHYALTKAFACKGMYPEAITEAQKNDDLSGVSAGTDTHLAWVYARSGDRDSAAKIIDEVVKNDGPPEDSRAAFDLAGAYAELGEKDKAFALLEKMFAVHGGAIVWLKVDPEVERLRGDPRYDDLVRRLGL